MSHGADTKRKTHRLRRWKLGAGRKFAFPPADRLLTLPMHYLTYTAHAPLEFPFGAKDGPAASIAKEAYELTRVACEPPGGIGAPAAGTPPPSRTSP